MIKEYKRCIDSIVDCRSCSIGKDTTKSCKEVIYELLVEQQNTIQALELQVSRTVDMRNTLMLTLMALRSIDMSTPELEEAIYNIKEALK